MHLANISWANKKEVNYVIDVCITLKYIEKVLIFGDVLSKYILYNIIC